MCHGKDDLRIGFTIYGLVSPSTGLPFYIGRTTTVELRWATHFLNPQTAPMALMMAEFKKAGRRPPLLILATDARGCVENWWIKKLTLMGYPLLNHLYPKTCELVSPEEWETRQHRLHGTGEFEAAITELQVEALLSRTYEPPDAWLKLWYEKFPKLPEIVWKRLYQGDWDGQSFDRAGQ